MKRVHGSTKINSSEIIICVHITDLSYDGLATCAYIMFLHFKFKFEITSNVHVLVHVVNM